MDRLQMLIDIPKDNGNNPFFGVALTNNSLLPLYEKGTVFILTTVPAQLEGDIILARIQNHINSLKRLYIKNNKYYLKNINFDESLDAYSIHEVEILGRVLQIIQNTN